MKCATDSARMYSLRSLRSPTFASRIFQHIVRWEHTSLKDLAINDSIKRNLQNLGITSLFPVQEKTIPSLLKGNDVICRSKTGSGKTLAFAVPIINRVLNQEPSRTPVALIIAPTRELVAQIREEFNRIHRSVKCVGIYGGASYDLQINALRHGADVIVGTPGRVVDLLGSGHIVLDNVSSFVLDEADRMLEIGFQQELDFIFSRLPEKKQTSLFSATIPKWINEVQKNYLNRPEYIDMVGDDFGLPEKLTNIAVVVSNNHSRIEAFHHIISSKASNHRIIVFTSTKREVDELSSVDIGISLGAIHGDKSQPARERVLQSFKNGRSNVLIATDVAARGLDIPNVDFVIHYRLPLNAEAFMHRSGRTARAGKEGTNIFFVDGNDYQVIRDIRTLYKVDFTWTSIPVIASKQFKPKIHSTDDVSTDRFPRVIVSNKINEDIASVDSKDTLEYNHQHGILNGEPDHVTYSLRVPYSEAFSPSDWIRLVQDLDSVVPGFKNFSPLRYFRDELYFDCHRDLVQQLEGAIKNFRYKSQHPTELARVTGIPGAAIVISDIFQPSSQRFSRTSNTLPSYKFQDRYNNTSYPSPSFKPQGRYNNTSYPPRSYGNEDSNYFDREARNYSFKPRSGPNQGFSRNSNNRFYNRNNSFDDDKSE